MAKANIGTLLRDFDAAKEVQTQYDGEWKLSLSFLGGAQYVQYDRVRRSVDQAPVASTPRRRRRPIHNLIAPNFEIVTSKLGAFFPALVALPTSPDPDDAGTARIATALLYRQREVALLEVAMQDFIDVMTALGTGVIWGDYNRYAHPPVNVEMPDPATGMMQRVTINSGEVDYKVLMPWQIFPDPMAYTPEEARWTELIDLMDIDEAARLYNKSPEEFGEVTESTLRSFSEFYIPMSNNSAPIIAKKARKDRPPTAIHHRFDRPCAAYPRGRWVVWTEKSILFEQDALPYGMDDFPFAVATFRKLPSRYWGKGLISDLIQPQITRNFNLGRLAEYMDMMAFPPLLIPFGSLTPKDKKSFTGDPGQMVDYLTGSGEPHYMQGSSGMNMTEFGIASQDMGEISNIPPVAKGVSPARERISGTAVNALRAEHQEALGKPLRKIMRAYKHMGKVGLYIAADKYEDARVFYILGPQRSQQWFSLGLEGQPGIEQQNQVSFSRFRQMVKSGMDVVVEADPGTPMTRQERQEFILGLIDRLGRMNPMFLPIAMQMLSAGGIYGDVWATLGMGMFSQMMGGQSPQQMGQQAQQAAQSQQGGGEAAPQLPPEIEEMLSAVMQGGGGEAMMQ